MMITNIDLNPLYKQKADIDDSHEKASDLYPILSASELLTEQSFEFTIKDIQKHVLVPKENFEDVYTATIHNFAEFVQSLPNSQYHSFNFSKGHLLLALLRANIAINESDNYPCPPSSELNATNPLILEKRAAIWNYCIFSSALLLDIGKTISGLLVDTCNKEGKAKLKWVPIDGPMTENSAKNSHYHYKSHRKLSNTDNHKLNILLVRLIIPDYVFSWIYSEPDIFYEWIGIFEDESTGSGSMHKLNVVTIRKLLNEYMGNNLPKNILRLVPVHIKEKEKKYHKDSFWKGVEFSLRGEKTQTKNTENAHGMEFLNWLKEGLLNKSISVNKSDSKVHISKEGVFLINPEIFLEFCNKYPKYGNWQTVFRQFNNLGITKFSSNTNIFQYRFPNLAAGEARRGLIIEDYRLIYASESVPKISPEISRDPVEPVKNSTIFPNPRQEVGEYTRIMYNPRPDIL